MKPETAPVASPVLPEPYYVDESVTLYHGDCRTLFDILPSVDAVITDPPYGLGDKMQGGTWGSANKYQDLRGWDISPDKPTLEKLITIAPSCVIWGGNYFHLPPSRCWLIWDKQNAVQTMADVEMAWTSIDRPCKRISLPVGVHTFGHPTEKPLSLMRWTLKQVPEVKVVLDPYCGSGTTLIAAKDFGMSAIGVEISEKYCEIAANRLRQGVLFPATSPTEAR